MDLEEGNSPFCYWEKSIAHCKSHDFTFLPFTLLLSVNYINNVSSPNIF